MNNEIAESIRAVAQGLMGLADALLLQNSSKESDGSVEPAEQPVEVKKPKKAKKKSEQEATTDSVIGDQTGDPVTRDQLREYLGSLAANGHSDEVSSLLKEYGEGKLSTVPEENYQALYAAAKEIGEEAPNA